MTMSALLPVSMHFMLKTCEEFALSHNLKFSTDPNPQKCKTKNLAFLKRPRPLPNLYLCGNPLPWTDKCKHLGVHLENKINGCEYDMRVKKAVLWNLFSSGSLGIEGSFNRSVKIMLDLPWATHRSLIQPLTGETHVKLILIRRFLCFLEKMRKSEKAPLIMLMKEAMKDVRSVTGSNLRKIMLLVGKTSVEDINVEDVDTLEYFKLDENEFGSGWV